MKALSIRQPFASLILTGKKTIETRNWATKYRGPLLICSGTSIHNGIVFEDGNAKSAAFYAKANDMWDWHLRGVSLCVVDLINCREMAPSDCEEAYCIWYPRAFAWELENVRPVQKRVVAGKLRLFDVPDEKIIYL